MKRIENESVIDFQTTQNVKKNCSVIVIPKQGLWNLGCGIIIESLRLSMLIKNKDSTRWQCFLSKFWHSCD